MIFQENEKTTCNQTIYKKSYSRDKHLGCAPNKIIETILEVNEGRTSTNGLENRKTNYNA